MKPTDSLHDLAPTTGHVENADGLLARILQYNINMILKTVPDGRKVMGKFYPGVAQQFCAPYT